MYKQIFVLYVFLKYRMRYNLITATFLGVRVGGGVGGRLQTGFGGGVLPSPLGT